METDGKAAETQMKVWYATASHRLVNRGGGDIRELPFGIAHLRKLGEPSAACGAPTLNWPIFWDLPASALDDLCSECRCIARLDEPPVPAAGT